MNKSVFFTGFPYLFIAFGIMFASYRYKVNQYQSELINHGLFAKNENKFATLAWYSGVLFLLSTHVLGFIFPSLMAMISRVPFLLTFFELTSISFVLCALYGLYRIYQNINQQEDLKKHSGINDYAMILLLALFLITKVMVLLCYRFESSWFALQVAPYYRSLLTLRPNTSLIEGLPTLIKFNMAQVFFILALIPSSRFLVEMIFPFHKLKKNC